MSARLFILDMMVVFDGIFGHLRHVRLSARLARRLTRSALVPAEATLRRAILILVADLSVPVLGATKPRATPEADYLPEDQWPRIIVLRDAVLLAPPAPAPRAPSAAICRRYAALRAAFENARGEAER